jgi:tRNA 2-thiouridine synthesizing protein A
VVFQSNRVHYTTGANEHDGACEGGDPGPVAALAIDITGETCPMTFVRTRLALDRLQSGQTLAVRLRGEEPERSVPRTCAEQGHTLLAQTVGPDGVTTLLLRRK